MVSVRVATRDDAVFLASLIDALDVHYRGDLARRPATDAIAMIERTFDLTEGTRFLLAEHAGQAVGIACFTIIRPGHALQGLIFLKDLFVVETVRGHGVGRALMAALACFAIAHGIGRIDLETSPDNAGAQRLYARLGGAKAEKLQYRYDGDTLRRLAHDRS